MQPLDDRPRSLRRHQQLFLRRRGDRLSVLCAGDPPKRVVVLGFESLDEVKKWQGGEYAKLIPVRDQIGKWRSFVVPTCENPQGAKPGQTKCP